MSRFTVLWLESAQAHLAHMWVNAKDRQAVASTADAIDALLAIDPSHKGTPVSEGLLSLYVAPLHVLYEVREGDMIVEVASVRMDQDNYRQTQSKS